MDSTESEELPDTGLDNGTGENISHGADEIVKLKADYRGRLVTAALRTEAVRAGMVDLDGLRLLDTASIALNEDDTVVNGSQIMQTLRKNKPWLFRAASSSSASVAPGSRPIRQKSAMEMTDEEYAAARSALLRY